MSALLYPVRISSPAIEPPPESAGVAHVKVARKFFTEDPFWTEARVFSKAEAWLDLIQTAAWTELRRRNAIGTIEVLQRGEFTASVRYLAQHWKWSKSGVQRFLSQLVEIGHLRVGQELGHQLGRVPPTILGQKQSVYVVQKYDTYQGTPRNSGTGVTGLSGTTAGTRSGTNNKAVKHKSSKNNYMTPVAPVPGDFAIPADAGLSATDEQWSSWISDADTLPPDVDGVVGYIGFEEVPDAMAEFETAQGMMLILPLGVPVEPSVPVGPPTPPKLDKAGNPAYPADFEDFWKSYPQRSGDNPKKGAYRCWSTNLRKGATAAEMQTSVETYALHCRGKLGGGRVIECTGFVKQASTFLGRDEAWKDYLDIAVIAPAPAPEGPAEEVAGIWASIRETATF